MADDKIRTTPRGGWVREDNGANTENAREQVEVLVRDVNNPLTEPLIALATEYGPATVEAALGLLIESRTLPTDMADRAVAAWYQVAWARKSDDVAWQIKQLDG